MTTITPERLTALSPKILPQRAQEYAPALDAVLAMGDITTPLRVAHFMAQLAYESAGFRALVENLNYRPETLLKVFPNRIKSLEQAQSLVAQGKEAIANAVYGNRADLGNTNPGDGYKYIGRGFLMITGRANYTRYAALIGQPLVDRPELLEQPLYAAQAAAAFWKATNINPKADADDINGVTKLVNGGLNGLDGRKALLSEAKSLWPVSIFAPEVTQVVDPTPPPPPSPPTPAGAFSRYFTLEELTQSDTAVRLHIDNTPPADVVNALHETATKMDQVRDLLKGPVQVLSGYRNPKLNTAIGGSPHSAHMTGRAVDFVCRSYGTPLQICQKIVSAGIKFDQLIQEGTWVHISFDPQMRNQVLTAVFSNGRTTYRSGL